VYEHSLVRTFLPAQPHRQLVPQRHGFKVGLEVGVRARELEPIPGRGLVAALEESLGQEEGRAGRSFHLGDHAPDLFGERGRVAFLQVDEDAQVERGLAVGRPAKDPVDDEGGAVLATCVVRHVRLLDWRESASPPDEFPKSNARRGGQCEGEEADGEDHPR